MGSGRARGRRALEAHGLGSGPSARRPRAVNVPSTAAIQWRNPIKTGSIHVPRVRQLAVSWPSAGRQLARWAASSRKALRWACWCSTLATCDPGRTIMSGRSTTGTLATLAGGLSG